MQNEKVYMSDNALKHVSPVARDTSWPPPWLVKAREIAKANPLPPPPAPPPGLEDVRVDQFDEPCPTCGSLERWWDVLGNPHCQLCEGDKLRSARALLDFAARLRSRKRQ